MDRRLFSELLNTVGCALNNPDGRLFQQKNEWESFLEFVSNYFSLRDISKPLVVEIGIENNAQKIFYEKLMGAEHIGIDIKGAPDILGDSHSPNTLGKLKEVLNGRRIDLLFIDGDHTFEGVQKDYDMYSPLVNHLVAFHDIFLVRWRTDRSEVVYFWDLLVDKERDKTLMTFKRWYDCAEQSPGQMGIGLVIKDRPIKITVITRWFNDALLAPFFLNHYSYADEIIILLTKETTDKSRKIIAKHPNARVVEFKFSNGFNCREAMEEVTKQANASKSDWIICVDADEFVFPKDNAGVRDVLSSTNGNLIYADFWQVYKNKREMALDPSIPVVHLRRFGDPNRTEGVNGLYRKPIIVKPGLDIKWGVGLHSYEPNPKIVVSEIRFDGAHWGMADLSIALQRRLRGRRKFVSKENIEKGWSDMNFDITEEQIRAECKRHEDDPQLF